MNVDNLNNGEKIAAGSGIGLILAMFIFTWFKIDLGVGGEVFGVDIDTGANAWQAFGGIDLILFITAAAAIALAVMAAGGDSPNLPVAGSAIVAGLGILSTVLVLYRVIDPPGPGGVDRGIGVFIGLILTGAIAYGGWMAMQAEGTSFGDQADRLSDSGGSGGSGPPPTA